MTDAFEWRGRVGDAWAEEWRRTDRSLAPVQQALLDTLLPLLAARSAVLDVGCGGGATSLALADARPDARVTGLDLSEALVAAARQRAGGRAAFETGDASCWRPADGRRFDALVSRHGVMFFDDPVAAFGHLRGLMAPGAPFVFSCFRSREENRWAAELVPVMQRFAPPQAAAPPTAPGPFAFADQDRIRAILDAAGFTAPRIDPLDFPFVAAKARIPWRGAGLFPPAAFCQAMLRPRCGPASRGDRYHGRSDRRGASIGRSRRLSRRGLDRLVRVRLIGLPTDSHSSFLRGAAQGPAAIRAALASDYSNMAAESGLELGADIPFEDIGDLPLREDADDPARIRDAVTNAARAGWVPIALGGDHMVTGPIVAALAQIHGPLNILHVDAHPDLYDDFDGDPLSHASPFARVMEAGHARRLVRSASAR